MNNILDENGFNLKLQLIKLSKFTGNFDFRHVNLLCTGYSSDLRSVIFSGELGFVCEIKNPTKSCVKCWRRHRIT